MAIVLALRYAEICESETSLLSTLLANTFTKPSA